MGETNEVIKVLLVDDHAVLRSGMRYILDLEDIIDVIGEASNGIEALDLCEILTPDVVLMDLMMPEMDGVEATRLIREKFPLIKVVVLTSFEDMDKVSAALEAGAISYLTKNISAPELSSALINAKSGISTMSPKATEALLQSRKTPGPEKFDLSSRELEVLEQMAIGLTNPEIANVLMISKSTVKRHVSNILSKMDVSTRTEAVSTALSLKIIR
jgi:NarL family two-component system response regulator LiaR